MTTADAASPTPYSELLDTARAAFSELSWGEWAAKLRLALETTPDKFRPLAVLDATALTVLAEQLEKLHEVEAAMTRVLQEQARRSQRTSE